MWVTSSLTLPFDSAIKDVDFSVSSLGILDEVLIILPLILFVQAR
jgi:hypothetical protein